MRTSQDFPSGAQLRPAFVARGALPLAQPPAGYRTAGTHRTVEHPEHLLISASASDRVAL